MRQLNLQNLIGQVKTNGQQKTPRTVKRLLRAPGTPGQTPFGQYGGHCRDQRTEGTVGRSSARGRGTLVVLALSGPVMGGTASALRASTFQHRVAMRRPRGSLVLAAKRTVRATAHRQVDRENHHAHVLSQPNHKTSLSARYRRQSLLIFRRTEHSPLLAGSHSASRGEPIRVGQRDSKSPK